MSGSDIAVLDTVTTVDEAVAAMAAYALEWPPSSADGLRVAIGTSEMSGAVVERGADRRTARRTRHSREAPVHYTIGPSVGAHTGPGTSGLFVF